MNTLTLTLPDSIHNQLRQLADREGVSVDQLATAALSEKIAALLSVDYLMQRAQRGNRSQFEEALANVGDTEPDQQDTP